jgi:hypothetical protein
LSPRTGYVREVVVDQRLAFLSVHVDWHSIRGLALAAVAGHSVTIVNMRVLVDVESDFQARVHPDFEVVLGVDVFDSAEITISNLAVRVMAR